MEQRDHSVQLTQFRRNNFVKILKMEQYLEKGYCGRSLREFTSMGSEYLVL
jgi:hypothetical protein